mmetsp:Transcript_24687/g.38415  ORF Transcript_24687/g.38415 Transcript_24687/m.38415 type:complete len:107 (+) Transcript_24687:206-526(+)
MVNSGKNINKTQENSMMQSERKPEDKAKNTFPTILEDAYDDNIRPFNFNMRKLLAFMGPGFLMSIAYLDPGNIAGDLEAGVTGAYSLIWALFWATACGWFYQAMAA